MAKEEQKQEVKHRGRPSKKKPPDLSWVGKGIESGVKIEIVPLADIDDKDLSSQCRIVTGNVGPLRKSIKADGQQEPVTLFGKKPPYKIVDGFRRTQSIKALGGDSVKAIIRKELSTKDALQLAFIENDKRKNLSTLDRANVVFRLKESGLSTQEIAQKLSLSEKQIQRYETISNLPTELRNAIDDATFTMAHALYLKQAADRNKDISIPRFIKSAKDGKQSAKSFKEVLNYNVKKSGRKRKFLSCSSSKISTHRFSLELSKATPPEIEALTRSLEQALEVLKKAKAK